MLIHNPTLFTLFSFSVDCPHVPCWAAHIPRRSASGNKRGDLNRSQERRSTQCVTRSPFFFTDHEDGIPLAVDGKVTRHADSFQQGYIVFEILYFPGVFTSPRTEKLRFINSTVTTGSFTRFSSSFSLCFTNAAIWLRVMPATVRFPNTGKSMAPLSSSVYPEISPLLLLLFSPVEPTPLLHARPG